MAKIAQATRTLEDTMLTTGEPNHDMFVEILGYEIRLWNIRGITLGLITKLIPILQAVVEHEQKQWSLPYEIYFIDVHLLTKNKVGCQEDAARHRVVRENEEIRFFIKDVRTMTGDKFKCAYRAPDLVTFSIANLLETRTKKKDMR